MTLSGLINSVLNTPLEHSKTVIGRKGNARRNKSKFYFNEFDFK